MHEDRKIKSNNFTSVLIRAASKHSPILGGIHEYFITVSGDHAKWEYATWGVSAPQSSRKRRFVDRALA